MTIHCIHCGGDIDSSVFMTKAAHSRGCPTSEARRREILVADLKAEDQ